MGFLNVIIFPSGHLESSLNSVKSVNNASSLFLVLGAKQEIGTEVEDAKTY